MNFTGINEIISLVIDTYNTKSREEFNAIYAKHSRLLNSHKNYVFEKNFGKVVTLTGRFARSKDGKFKNLNLITPAYLNGERVEHIHVYDEVIALSDINPTTGMMICENLKVYKFSRNKRHSFIGLGLKPIGAPFWKDRFEIE